jgi:hypothetical protein
LEETGAVQRRLRKLPSRVGVYFLLALALFPNLGYGRVWNKLVAGLPGLNLPTASEKALRDLRRRVGVAPLEGLFQVLAGPVAQPRTPGVRYRRFTTVALDGCSALLGTYLSTRRCRFVFADAGFAGRLVEWARRVLGVIVDIVRKPEGQKGFSVLPRRWAAERSLAWITAHRRLARDYE